jgi:hypothetical protein
LALKDLRKRQASHGQAADLQEGAAGDPMIVGVSLAQDRQHERVSLSNAELPQNPECCRIPLH